MHSLKRDIMLYTGELRIHCLIRDDKSSQLMEEVKICISVPIYMYYMYFSFNASHIHDGDKKCIVSGSTSPKLEI